MQQTGAQNQRVELITESLQQFVGGQVLIRNLRAKVGAKQGEIKKIEFDQRSMNLRLEFDWIAEAEWKFPLSVWKEIPADNMDFSVSAPAITALSSGSVMIDPCWQDFNILVLILPNGLGRISRPIKTETTQ